MLKVITWALILAGILNAVTLLPQRPGTAALLEVLQPGAFTIVALSIAAAAHDRKDLIIVILLGTLLAVYPFEIQDLARWLAPLGLGICLGRLLRSAILHEHRHDTTTR